MKIENIDIEATIEKAQRVVREDKQLSAATKSIFEIMILIITLFETIKLKVTAAGGALYAQESQKYRLKCRAILKQGVKSSHALDLLFNGKLPDFLM